MTSQVGSELVIPVNEATLGVVVPLNALPDDEAEILQILQAEQAPLRLWIEFANAYLAAGKKEQCRNVINDGCHPDIEQYYQNFPYERLSLYCAQASFCIRQARFERRQQNELYAKAAESVNKAMSINVNEQLPYVTQTWLLLAKGDLDGASKSLDLAIDKLDNGHKNVAPLLGKAVLANVRGKPAEALRILQRVLQVHPGCPASVRAAIGACYLQQGETARAEAAYQRAADLDPQSADALVGLAVCKMNAGEPETPERAQGIREALRLLRRAVDADRLCAPALVLLSEHFSLVEDARAAAELATAAFYATEAPAIRAAAAARLGLAHQTAGRSEEAEQWFKAALKLAPGLAAAEFGLGQVALRRGEVRQAQAAVERALKGAPGNRQALRLVGMLSAATGSAEQAAAALRRSAEESPDAESLCLLGELLEREQPEAAEEAFRLALRLLERKWGAEGKGEGEGGEERAVALLNNVAVLQAYRGARDRAREKLRDALRRVGWGWACAEDPAEVAAASAALPAEGPAQALAFNLACVEGDSGRMRLQEALLAALDRSRGPDGAPEAHLRRASLASRRGNFAAAEAHVGRALAANPEEPDALAMRGFLALQRRDAKAARAAFDRLREVRVDEGPLVPAAAGAAAAAGSQQQQQGQKNNDSYAVVGLACAAYMDARRVAARAAAEGAKASKAAESVEEHMGRALSLFARELQRNPGNAFAALGVGVILAERGYLDDAKLCFSLVSEVGGGGQVAAVALENLARCAAAQRDGAGAVRIVRQAVRRRGCPDAEAETLLAVVYEQWEEREREHVTDCRRASLHALHLAPNDAALRFNVGYALQKKGGHCHRLVEAMCREQKKAAGTVSALEMNEQSLRNVAHALQAFTQLTRLVGERTPEEEAARVAAAQGGCVAAQHVLTVRQRVQAHIKLCDEWQRTMAGWRQGAEEYDAALQRALAAAEEARRAAAEKAAAEKRAVEEAEERKRRDHEALVEQARQRQERIVLALHNRAEADAAADAAKAGKARGGGGGAGGGGGGGGKSAGKKRAAADVYDDEAAEGEEEVREESELEEADDSGPETEEEVEGGAGEEGKPRKEKRSKKDKKERKEKKKRRMEKAGGADGAAAAGSAGAAGGAAAGDAEMDELADTDAGAAADKDINALFEDSDGEKEGGEGAEAAKAPAAPRARAMIDDDD